MKRLRILIADDHELVRRGIREVLHSRPGWRVVGEAANGREAVAKAIELKPDVAVVDIGMPELDGIEAARQIREAVPRNQNPRAHDERVRPYDTTCTGRRCQGYLLKSDLTDVLPKAVEAIVAGKRFLTSKVSEIVLEGFLKTRGQHQVGGGESHPNHSSRD